MLYNVKINGKQYEVEIEKAGAGFAQPAVQAPVYQQPVAQPVAPAPVAQAPVVASAATETVIESPMPGNVFDIKVSVGQQVNAGDCLLILEAMKMENEVVAPCAGVVKQILVNKGTAVDTDDVLVVLN